MRSRLLKHKNAAPGELAQDGDRLADRGAADFSEFSRCLTAKLDRKGFKSLKLERQRRKLLEAFGLKNVDV